MKIFLRMYLWTRKMPVLRNKRICFSRNRMAFAVTRLILCRLNTPKCICGWSFSLDPAWEANSVFPDSLADLRGESFVAEGMRRKGVKRRKGKEGRGKHPKEISGYGLD